MREDHHTTGLTVAIGALVAFTIADSLLDHTNELCLSM